MVFAAFLQGQRLTYTHPLPAAGLYGMAMLAHLLVSANEQWVHMPLRRLQFFGGALLLHIAAGYCLVWLCVDEPVAGVDRFLGGCLRMNH